MTQFTPSIKQVDSGSVSSKGDLKRAQALAKEGRFEEASKEYEAVLKADPSSFPAQMGAGNTKLRLRQPDESIVHYQAACRIDPLKAQPYMRLGRIYATQKQYDQAVAQYQNVIKLDSKSPAGYVGLGGVLLLKGNYPEATENLLQALRLNPRLLSARRRLAQAYAQQKNFPEAVAQLNAALRIEPENSGTYVGLGRIYLTQKDYKSARRSFQEAVNVNPDAPTPARLGLAECLLAENKPSEASEVLSQVEIPQRDSVRSRYHQLWGDTYFQQGLYKESVEEYQAAVLITSKEKSDGVPTELPKVDMTISSDSEQWKTLANQLQGRIASAVDERRTDFDTDFDD